MVFDVNAPGDRSREVIVDPADDLRQKNLSGLCSETLLEPLARGGRCVLDAAELRDALAARARAQAGLATARREPEAHAQRRTPIPWASSMVFLSAAANWLPGMRGIA